MKKAKERTKERVSNGTANAEVVVRTAGWFAYLSGRECKEIKSCRKKSEFEVHRKGESAKKRYPCLTHLGRVVNELLRGKEEEDVE